VSLTEIGATCGNRDNIAERLGFPGRLNHGNNPRAWLNELRQRIGEKVDFAAAMLRGERSSALASSLRVKPEARISSSTTAGRKPSRMASRKSRSLERWRPRARSPPSSLTTALSSFTILSLIIATNFRTTSRNGKGVARLPEPSCWIKDQSCNLADFQLALGILGFARHATRTTKEWNRDETSCHKNIANENPAADWWQRYHEG